MGIINLFEIDKIEALVERFQSDSSTQVCLESIYVIRDSNVASLNRSLLQEKVKAFVSFQLLLNALDLSDEQILLGVESEYLIAWHSYSDEGFEFCHGRFNTEKASDFMEKAKLLGQPITLKKAAIYCAVESALFNSDKNVVSISRMLKTVVQ